MINFILCVVLELITCFILLSKTIINNNYNTTITLVVLIVFLLLSKLLFKGRNSKSRNKDAIIVITLGTMLIQMLIYVLSIKTGFSKNIYSLFNGYILNFEWIKIFIIVFLMEYIRNTIMSIDIRSNMKKSIIFILLVILGVAVDINISTISFSLRRFSEIFDYSATILVQSLAKNIFLCYIARRYGYKPLIIYRVIMDLIIYILPISDSLNEFIKAVLIFSFPFFLYIIIERVDEEKIAGNNNDNKKKAKEKKSLISEIINVTFTIFIAVLVILVSRETTYCMIGVGSESMTGAVNKGDALVYKKYDLEDAKYESKRLKVGDIIVFRKNNVLILHRINAVIPSGGEDKYITKGDYNKSIDSWIVSQEDIEGVALFRIKYIAWPSVWIGEMFS